MKKIVALILSVIMLISINTTVLGKEPNYGERITLEGKTHYIMTTQKEGKTVTIVYNENKEAIQKTTYFNSNGNIVEENLNKKTKKSKNISQFVNNEPIEIVTEQTNVITPRMDYNYLYNEPIFDTGLTTWSEDGYKYIGYMKEDASKINGYLYRKQYKSDLTGAKKFTFSAGTQVSTIISVIAGACGGAVGLAVALATFGIGAAVDYAFSPVVKRIQTHNYYRVRVTSNFTLRYSFCKCVEYWDFYAYNKNTGKNEQNYTYKEQTHGYPGTLDFAVADGVSFHLQNKMVTRPC